MRKCRRWRGARTASGWRSPTSASRGPGTPRSHHRLRRCRPSGRRGLGGRGCRRRADPLQPRRPSHRRRPGSPSTPARCAHVGLADGELLDSIETLDASGAVAERRWVAGCVRPRGERIAVLDVASGRQVAVLAGQTGDTGVIAFSRDERDWWQSAGATGQSACGMHATATRSSTLRGPHRRRRRAQLPPRRVAARLRQLRRQCADLGAAPRRPRGHRPRQA